MMFVSRFWRQLIGEIDTHLNDGAYFKGFLWLFLKVIMERDWLGCDDVDECLDKLVLCLTRHIKGNGLHTMRRAWRNVFAQIRFSGPAQRTPTFYTCF
jgi:hypothetical protein